MRPSVAVVDHRYRDAGRHVPAAPADIPLERLLAMAETGVADLDENVVVALANLACGTGPAAVVVTGVDVGEPGPTPPTPDSRHGWLLPADLTLLTLARILGHVIGYEPEHGGNVIQHLVPVRGAEQLQTSTSSSTALDWHTETAFHPHRPDYVGLLAVRGDDTAPTRLVDVDAIVSTLDDHVVEQLTRSAYTTGVDVSFGGGQHRSACGAVLRVTTSGWRLWWDKQLMCGVDGDADAALDEFAAAVDRCAFEVTLVTGNCLFFDNARVAHARGPYQPRYDGTDRWMRRCFVRNELPDTAFDISTRTSTMTWPR